MKLKEWIQGLFNKFVAGCKQLLKDALPLVYQIIIGELYAYATTMINALNASDFSNEEKRKKAFDAIKAYAKKHSIKARDSLISALIELVVLSLKPKE